MDSSPQLLDSLRLFLLGITKSSLHHRKPFLIGVHIHTLVSRFSPMNWSTNMKGGRRNSPKWLVWKIGTQGKAKQG